MNKLQSEIGGLIQARLREFQVAGKSGKRLERKVADVLAGAGLDVDREDSRRYLASKQPAWRDKTSGEIEETRGRLRIDLVVRSGDDVVALVEVESDLNDLREIGVSQRSGHYDVLSIARNSAGEYFHSYKSLERMAAATFYAAGGTPEDLEGLRSDAPIDHNPRGQALFLVTGVSRALDRRILAPRVQSLGAHLISLTER